MCATYIVWALSPEACSRWTKSGIFAGCIRMHWACWRKTNNYCMALKGGRIWFVKRIIICFIREGLFFCSFYFLLVYLLLIILFRSRYLNSTFSLSKWYSFFNYLIILMLNFSFQAEIEKFASLFIVKEELKFFIKWLFIIIFKIKFKIFLEFH